jgi:glucose-1-phosphate thymidylyltransferase
MLMLAGIREILIISAPDALDSFRNLLGTGEQWGLSFQYAEQAEPRGLADAFIVGREFVGDSPVCLILGDNIFYGQGLGSLLQECAALTEGALLFGYYVNDPERYGIVEFGVDDTVLSLEEKPQNPRSNYAVPGIYFYDRQAVTIAESLQPSVRGELEITDLNNIYLCRGQLQAKRLGRGIAWLDAGTHESLLQAAHFVQVVQQRQGLMVASPEEIAYRRGYINAAQLQTLAAKMSSTSYGAYLLDLLEERLK